MEDNSDSIDKHDKYMDEKVQKKKFSFGKFLFRLLFLAVIVLGGYYAFNHYGDRLGFNKEFDQENSAMAEPAELVQQETKASISVDTLTSILDSIRVSLEDSTSTLEDRLAAKKVEGEEAEEESGFFDVNTEYDDLEAPEDVVKETAIAAHDQEVAQAMEAEHVDEMIEEIIAPMNLTEAEARSFKNFYKEDILSSGSVIKLIAVTGNHFLSGEDTSLDKDILDALLVSEEVVSIVIVDRNGKVVYSNDRKQMNRSIRALMPTVDLSAQSLLFNEDNGSITVMIPLFKGYGRNGTALLVTKGI